LIVPIQVVADLMQTTQDWLPVSFSHCSAGSQPLKINNNAFLYSLCRIIHKSSIRSLFQKRPLHL
jgi:hypothetical protein